jgi:hypothetical protein
MTFTCANHVARNASGRARRDIDSPQTRQADAGIAARPRQCGSDDTTRPVVDASSGRHHAEDRARLQALLTVLDASPVALRRDLHRGEGRKGDHGIHGKFGHIYADGTGFLLCVTAAQSSRRWNNTKRRLPFCRLTQDGDDEGCLHLHRLPTPAEAGLIRGALGIERKRHLTPETLASLKGRHSARPTGKLSNDRSIDLIEQAATPVHTQQGRAN